MTSGYHHKKKRKRLKINSVVHTWFVLLQTKNDDNNIHIFQNIRKNFSIMMMSGGVEKRRMPE